MYSNFLRNFLLPLYETFKGKELLKYLNEYEQHLSWSSDQLRAYQWEKLTQLLAHCFTNTEFYPRVWREVGIDSIEDIKSLDDFYKLPTITKQDINQYYAEFVDKNATNNIKKSTGGSTGQPFHFEYNLESNTRREAIMWRGYGWLGAGLGQRTLYLWGADVGSTSMLKSIKNSLYHGFYNRKMLNSFAMNRDNMKSYVEEINKFKPKALVSYVNPLFELANYILENNISVFQPSTILTGAEPLHEHQRAVIQNAFKCPVYNTFGCREFMLMSAECKQEKNLHTNCDHLLIETVNENGQSITGASGDLVITDLFNYGMPLIRYVNGDRATLVESDCNCGNPLPIMKSIDGRKLDIIKTPSGKISPGELFPHLFKEFKEIQRFQVKQTELDKLTILIIEKSTLSEDNKQQIFNEINKYAENELALAIDIVEEIPLTASGKHRVTICEV